MADDNSVCIHVGKRVKDYFCVPKAVLFTFASFFGRAVVDYAFLGYIFVEIERTSNMKTAALVSTAYECVSPFLYGLLGLPSYRLMPHLISNLITDASFVAGILMLWFTAPHWSSGILYLALALLGVGRTGDMLTTRLLFHYIRLGDDQIAVKNVLDRIDVWRSICRCPGAILGLWISKLGRRSAFKILAIVTIIGYVFLICGILYHKCQENERKPGETSNPSQEINQSSQKRSLITEFKQLRKLLLLYTPFLIYYVVEGAGNTFFYQQADTLNNHIGKIFFNPAATLYAIQKGTGLMTKLLMEILTITKWKKSEQWQRAKLILGLFVCFCCCKCSWYFEYFRRLDWTQSLNNLWMVPQFVLLGIAKELVEDGMEDVFFFHLKKPMHIWASAFFCFVNGLGSSLSAVFIAVLGKWIREDIVESRLDKYYFLLAMLTVLAILFFMCLLKFYASKIKPTNDDKEGPNKDDKKDTELTRLEGGKNLSSPSPHPKESPAESTFRSSDQVALSMSSNLDTTKSSSNSDSSVVKRHLSYLDQPSNPAAKVHYQRCHSHPITTYEGVTHQSSALSNLCLLPAPKSIHERSDGCSEMN